MNATHARGLEEIEAAVSEVVMAFQAGDDQCAIGERDLDDFAAEEVGLWDRGVRVEGVARAKSCL